MGTEIKAFRLEHDSIGEKKVPADAYYGVQTLRAAENFHITGLLMHPEMIISIAQIKKDGTLSDEDVSQAAAQAEVTD